MNAIISPAPTRGSLDRMVRRPALRAGPGRTGHALRQAGTFAAIGVVSTLAYVALYALLRPAVPAELANAAALLATAIGNTAANRRLTFSIRGRAGLARDHAAGLLALGAALAITSASLAVLQVAAPGAPPVNRGRGPGCRQRGRHARPLPAAPGGLPPGPTTRLPASHGRPRRGRPDARKTV